MENFDLQAYWDAVLRQDAQAMETFLVPERHRQLALHQ